MMRVFTREVEGKSAKVVAVCDAELLGKTFRDELRVLDLKRFASFYEGEKAEAARVEEELRSAHSINLVGSRAVAVAVAAGLIAKEDVVTVGGIPHVQIYPL